MSNQSTSPPKFGFASLKTAFLSAVFLLTAIVPATCRPTTPYQAQAAATAWLNLDASPLQSPMSRSVKDVRTYTDDSGSALYFVVSFEPEGFVIISADDLIEPIIAFSSTGTYDNSADSCLAALVNNDMASRIAEARQAEAKPMQSGFKIKLPDRLDKARGKWERLVSASSASIDMGISSVSDVRVAPFVQSRWNQQSACGAACYNYFVPPYAAGSSSNYPCGCVATALAQVMRYFQHPTTGVGTPSFSIKVDGITQSRQLRGGDGFGGPYNWADMLLVPSSYCGTITDTQRQAIGALCHDAGVAVNMQYASSGSGAYTHQTATALTNTFMYSHARRGFNGVSNIGASLNAMINPNLDAGYPVILGITGSSGGHAIVSDGYGYNISTLYHHLNLGWGGASDAWYNLPLIDTSYYTFTAVHTCVYNIFVTGTGEIISGRVTDSFGVPISGAAVTATRSGGGVYTATTNDRGIYALVKVPASSQYTVYVQKSGYAFQPQSVTTGSSADMSTTCGNRPGIDFTASNGVILTDIDTLSVPEGGTATFHVKLQNQPPGDITVSVARVSGDSDISVQYGSSVTFTTSNWNSFQPVTVAAAEDADAFDSSAVIHCSAIGWQSAEVAVKEYDNDGQSVRYMKTRTDGSPVHCSRTAVTAVFGDHFYIEDEDRSCGIRVHMAEHGLTVGTRVGVEGVISTDVNDERFIEASSVLAGDPYTIRPLGLANSALGGGSMQDAETGAGQNGVDGATGLNNIGLLVTTWGRVSLSSEDYSISWNLDSNPGWSTRGQWAFGSPTGGGGTQHGFPDPTSGHTGTNVYAINLNGDYSTTVGGPDYLVTNPIDLSSCSTVTLSYWRWLNADIQNYAIETVDVSGNGANWTQIWSNSGGEITDNSWTLQSFDISSVAGNRANVYVRWGHQTNSGVWAFSGWNIDDVSITGQRQTVMISDGSGTGVKLILPADVNAPQDGSYVVVTGISCCERDGQGNLRPVLKVRNASDIRPIP